MREGASIFRTLDLPSGAVVPFTSVPGDRVRILYGRVWLTEEGSARDAFLASGEEVSLGRRGLAVIEALGPARVQLLEDLPRPPAAVRVTAALAGRAVGLARRWAARAPRPMRGAV